MRQARLESAGNAAKTAFQGIAGHLAPTVRTVHLAHAAPMARRGPQAATARMERARINSRKIKGFAGTELLWLESLRGAPGGHGADGREGKDGRDGRDGKDGEAGRDALAIDILPGIDESKSYPRGTFAEHAADELCAIATPIRSPTLAWMTGWDCVVESMNGRLEAEETLDEGRTIKRTTHYTNGRELKREIKTSVILYRGVWREGEFDQGDVVTWGGSAWHCQQKTTDKPGTSAAWRLMVKEGARGKDGCRRIAPGKLQNGEPEMKFTLERVAGPDIEPVTLAEMKRHLRCQEGVEVQDDDITALIVAAREWVEDYTARALIDQTWRLTVDEIAGDAVQRILLRRSPVIRRHEWLRWMRRGEIMLRRSPILAVTSFKSIDAAGAKADVGTDTYSLREADSKWPRLVLMSGTWPSGTLENRIPRRFRGPQRQPAARRHRRADSIQAGHQAIGPRPPTTATNT